jgi:hypothetical protein
MRADAARAHADLQPASGGDASLPVRVGLRQHTPRPMTQGALYAGWLPVNATHRGLPVNLLGAVFGTVAGHFPGLDGIWPERRARTPQACLVFAAVCDSACKTNQLPMSTFASPLQRLGAYLPASIGPATG